MTEDDLKALEGLDLNEEQTKIIQSMVSGLVKNRDALLEEKRKLKERLGSNDDPSADELRRKVREMEAAQERAKLEAKENYEEALALSKKEFASQMEEKDNLIASMSRDLETLVVDRDLGGALKGVNVRPELADGAFALFRGQVEIKEGQAFLNDMPAAEALAEWAKSDEAKPWIAAPTNSGAGARGSQKGSPPTTAKKSDMTIEQKVAFISEHGRAAFEQLPI